MGKAVPPNLKPNVETNVLMKQKDVTKTDIATMEKTKMVAVSMNTPWDVQIVYHWVKLYKGADTMRLCLVKAYFLV